MKCKDPNLARVNKICFVTFLMYTNRFGAWRRIKKTQKAMTTILLTLPHPVWPRSKIRGEEGEGGEVGAGVASGWGERRRKREPEKKKKKKIKKSLRASPQKTIWQLLLNCVGPTSNILSASVERFSVCSVCSIF